MKVLVTGANGFLGSHVVQALNHKGYEVRAFVLEGTSLETLLGMQYELFEGNLLRPSDLDMALDGCDYVIHTAGLTDVWPTKNEASWKINFEVVKHLSEAVKKHTIQKYIHVGTANSFGFGSLEKPGTETSPFNGGVYHLDYIDSKKAAQDYLLHEVQNALPVVIINPTFMIGPNDSKPGSGEMILSIMARKVPGYAAGGRCFAAVKDVAQACVNAIELGQIGECYIAGGTNMCYQDFFHLVGELAQVKPPKRYIPTWLAIGFAALLEGIAGVKKTKPKLTRAMAKISGDGHYYSSDKAIHALNYPQTSLRTALQEAIAWYIEHGYTEQEGTQ